MVFLVIDALTPLEHHIDVAVARLRMAIYVMFHPRCRGYEETRVHYRYDPESPSFIAERSVVTFVGVIRGSALDGSLRLVRNYHGKLQFPLDTYCG